MRSFSRTFVGCLALYMIIALMQGCQTQFLEGHSPAEFSSNPAPTHIPCSYIYITFTFMHLADAFIQSDLFRLHIFFICMCVPWELNPQPFALLTQCSSFQISLNDLISWIRCVLIRVASKLCRALALRNCLTPLLNVTVMDWLTLADW